MIPRRRPAAVVFDCDGLLVETESMLGGGGAPPARRARPLWTPAVKAAMHGRSGTAAGETLAAFAGRGRGARATR